MTPQCLVVHRGKTAVRVRRERRGCFLFDSSGNCLEGNETVWEMVELAWRGLGYREIVSELGRRYELPAAMLRRDLDQVLDMLSDFGWLTDVRPTS